MQFEKFKNAQNICIYGYGVEGKSSEHFLSQHFPHLNIQIFEDSDGQTLDWEAFDIVIKSPGIPPSHVPPEHVNKVTSNIRIFLANLPEERRMKVIGITGSKGKSTTTKFCHELLNQCGRKAVIGGNFGTPFLDIFNDFIKGEYEFVVAECSSFQLYDLDISPGIAIFLSFFPDHLDWHGTQKKYLEAKKNLWAHQKLGNVFLITPAVQDITQGGHVCEKPATRLFPEKAILQADHFRQNLGTIWTLGEILELPNLERNWQKVAENFEMIEHRLERFAQKKGITFYNDSIATSPEAVEVAIKFFGSQLGTLILCGQDTGIGGFGGVVENLKRYAPQAKVLLIDSGVSEKFINVAQDQNFEAFQVCEDIQTVVSQSFEITPQNSVCLFSPGGKSFDQFENYRIRGRVFKESVNNYGI